MNDAQRLAEFLHTAKITVVAIAVLSNGDIEFNLETRG